jgi:hypothetical protein
MQDQIKKIAVLADLYLNHRDEIQFKMFADYHDIGLPIAHLVHTGLCTMTREAEKYVEETYAALIAALGVDSDKPYQTIEEMVLDHIPETPDSHPVHVENINKNKFVVMQLVSKVLASITGQPLEEVGKSFTLQSTSEDTGSIWYGSTATTIQYLATDSAIMQSQIELIHISSTGLLDAPFDDGIYAYMSTDLNNAFAKWEVVKDENEKMSISFGYMMPISGVTEESLSFAIRYVSNVAYSMNDILQKRFGGYLAQEWIDRQEKNDLSNNDDELEEDWDLEPIIVFDNWEGMPNLSIPAVASKELENLKSYVRNNLDGDVSRGHFDWKSLQELVEDLFKNSQNLDLNFQKELFTLSMSCRPLFSCLLDRDLNTIPELLRYSLISRCLYGAGTVETPKSISVEVRELLEELTENEDPEHHDFYSDSNLREHLLRNPSLDLEILIDEFEGTGDDGNISGILNNPKCPQELLQSIIDSEHFIFDQGDYNDLIEEAKEILATRQSKGESIEGNVSN